jgi:hypothetical protein
MLLADEDHMEVFSEQERRVAGARSKVRFESAALPDIAADELDRTPLHRLTYYQAILEWLVSTETLPFQANVDSNFGEPPVALLWPSLVYFEALFWCTSTTAINGHGFSGAFQVLAGTSVRSVYEFKAHNAHGRCQIGDLHHRDVALLRPGTTQTIERGERFVHSVFHLGYPSVTIVGRNRGGDSQYRYYRPVGGHG